MSAGHYSFELIKEQDIARSGEFLLYCPDCDRETAHKTMAGVILNYADDENDMESFYVTENHQIIKCNGCHLIRYKEEYYDSECYSPDKPEISIYPVKRKALDQFDIPEFLRKIYIETNSALASELAILAGIGLRSMVEAICKDLIEKQEQETGETIQVSVDKQSTTKKSIQEVSLKRKIEYFKEIRIFNENFEQILQIIREIGNDATHETKALPLRHLKSAMQIIEHFIRHHYLSPAIAFHSGLSKLSENKQK
jgi:hypothetical protein